MKSFFAVQPLQPERKEQKLGRPILPALYEVEGRKYDITSIKRTFDRIHDGLEGYDPKDARNGIVEGVEKIIMYREYRKEGKLAASILFGIGRIFGHWAGVVNAKIYDPNLEHRIRQIYKHDHLDVAEMPLKRSSELP